MLQSLIIALLICLWPQSLNPPFEKALLFIWNVGQGQWVTWRTQNQCLHFDMGGEWAPWKDIFQVCKNKEQQILISHFDQDHIKFIPRFLKTQNSLCYLQSPNKKSRLFTLSKCGSISNDNWQIIHRPTQEQIQSLPKKHRANSTSLITALLDKVLFPGDSPKEMEKYWGHFVKPTITLLLLGHHGSRTSTSEELLGHLPNLKQAIASLRHAKYGHPHIEVIVRLKNHGIGFIHTEDWGNIALEIN